jgi:hypothetical protein
MGFLGNSKESLGRRRRVWEPDTCGTLRVLWHAKELAHLGIIQSGGMWSFWSWESSYGKPCGIVPGDSCRLCIDVFLYLVSSDESSQVTQDQDN